MAEGKDDGGPAFPSQPVFSYPGGATSMSAQDGMTLRLFMGRLHACGAVEMTLPQQFRTITLECFLPLVVMGVLTFTVGTWWAL